MIIDGGGASLITEALRVHESTLDVIDDACFVLRRICFASGLCNLWFDDTASLFNTALHRKALLSLGVLPLVESLHAKSQHAEQLAAALTGRDNRRRG